MSDLAVGVGKSKSSDSYSAGREAASEALKKHDGIPEVLIVFGPPVFDHRMLLEGIQSIMGDIPMVGGTTAGEISNGGFYVESVVIVALSSKTLRFTTGIGKDMSLSEDACCEDLVGDLSSRTSFDDALTLMIFPNGLGGDGVKIIEGLQDRLGKYFEIVGGYLGDDDMFQKTFQFYNGKVFRDTIPGLLISGKGNFKTGIGVRSGFESIGNRFYCTESEGNIVKKFDDERALDLYKQFLGEERSQRLPQVCLDYPFGLIDDKVSIAGKEYFQLRAGLFVDHNAGTITLAGSIPEGSAITLTAASRGDIIKGAGLAAQQALESLNGAEPCLILMFSCIGRRSVLGRRTGEEVEAVRDVLGKNVPIAGFYTYGEIGPINKMNEDLSSAKFHNETVVLWVLGRKQENDNGTEKEMNIGIKNP